MKKIIHPVSQLMIMFLCSLVITKLGKDLLFSLESDILVLSEILLNMVGLALWIWPFVHSIRYFYLRFTGKTDEEIYPPKSIAQGLIELEKGRIEFGGSAKYNSISMANVEYISYQPIENNYQEVKITKKGEGTYIYHLINTKEYLNEKVKNFNKLLQVEARTALSG